ncbi:helix-turn-helix transcriptional regulator [Candidatus Saccharibacteria bacterium]|nr:helix-turn-helix transcriptional regulator [Candidatus Saccharibacteria bacterium]
MFYKQQEVPENAVAVARKARKLTQAELANAVGVTRQTIIAIEKGNYTPSVLLALKLAKTLGKSVEELFWI